MTHVRLVAGLVLFAACRPSVPEELKYRLHFEGGDTLSGVELQRDGVSIGKVTAANELEFATPSTVRPTMLKLEALLPTPCGTASAPVTLEVNAPMDEDRSVADNMKRNGVLRVTAKPLTAKRFTVLVNRGKGALEIGQASIGAQTRVTLFEKPGCDATAQVKAGGEIIGTWRASNPVTFISVPATCHKLSTVSYGNAVAGSSIVIHQRVRGLKKAPDFFLTPAPATVKAKGTERYFEELIETPCPEGAPPAEVARQAFERGGCFEAVPSLKRAIAWNNEDLASTALLVTCLAKSYSVSEATELAEATLELQPEARDQLKEAFVAAGHPEVTLAP